MRTLGCQCRRLPLFFEPLVELDDVYVNATPYFYYCWGQLVLLSVENPPPEFALCNELSFKSYLFNGPQVFEVHQASSVVKGGKVNMQAISHLPAPHTL